MKDTDMCSNCGYVFLTDGDGSIIDEMYICQSCLQTICGDCLIFNGEWEDKAIKSGDIYPYMDKSHQIECIKCVRKKERSFIDKLKYEDLALYVSHDWITRIGREAFLNKLNKGIL